MMFKLVRDEREIEDLQTAVEIEVELNRTQWSGKSYEEGVLTTLRWLFEEGEDNPMDM